jgi:hypothetical protein
VVKGGNLNQFDNQTAVREGEPYMLYIKARNKSIKRETSEGADRGNERRGTCASMSKAKDQDAGKHGSSELYIR